MKLNPAIYGMLVPMVAITTTVSWATPSVSQSRFNGADDRQQRTILEQPSPQIETTREQSDELQIKPQAPDTEADNPIDDPWTWFCLVHSEPEDLDDCINGIP